MLNSLHRQMSRGYAVTTSLMRTLMPLHFSDLHRTRTPTLSCCLMLFQSQIDIQLEAVCCNDNPDVMSRLENSGACITDNIFFNHITSEEGIEYSRALQGANIVNSWLREGNLSTAFTNNLKRNLSYRSFVTWINMNIPMGRGNRMVIPRCVVLKIRRSYPEVDHNYAGFQPSESH